MIWNLDQKLNKKEKRKKKKKKKKTSKKSDKDVMTIIYDVIPDFPGFTGLGAFCRRNYYYYWFIFVIENHSKQIWSDNEPLVLPTAHITHSHPYQLSPTLSFP